jgi:pimeloyl-ACP methyl ester carboxylesterase
MESREFQFKNRAGETLAGRLELPPTSPVAFALFAHCFTCSKNIKAATQISRGLRDQGIGVLRFDFTGLGNSEGDFANTNFSSNVQDLLWAADGLREEFESPKLLVGHSLGGAAALVAGGEIPDLAAVAVISAPSEPSHVLKLLTHELEAIETHGAAEVELAGQRFTIKRQFIEDLRSQSLENRLKKLRKPLLIYHSPSDHVVGIEHARAIFDAARHPKSFISLDGADHLVTRPRDAAFIARTLAAWSSRYLSDRET